MRLRRVVPLAVVLAAAGIPAAHAQFGGMIGFPGGPGGPAPSAPGGYGASPFGGQPAAPPSACQQLLVMRDETQKDAGAIQAANKRHASPVDACKLFKTFLASEAKMMQAMQQNSTTCNIPPEVIKQVREGHERATGISKQICEVAERGPVASGPTLSDALGSNPNVPDASSTKPGHSATFDTITGNALAK
jgi:hypothetical protein